MDEIEIKQLMEKGYLKVRVFFEMLGKPKEHVEETLKKYIERIKTDENIKFIEEDYAEAEEKEDGLWSTFVEAVILVNGMDKLTWLCINFMPASIEIIEPEEKKYTNKQIGFWINDVLSKLHEISLMTKTLANKNKQFAGALGTMLRNMILLSLETGDLTAEELVRKTGIRLDQVNDTIKVLMEEKRIEKEGDLYKRIVKK